jgi:hypothetical protein
MSAYPTVVSFFGGDQYYYDAGAMLRQDCERLGLAHHIREQKDVAGLNWAQICRLKVRFYLAQLHACAGPILWCDVDNRILRRPEALRGCGFDMAGYAQKLRYIRDFDKYDIARFWIPGILYFNNTPKAVRFLEHMNALESASDQYATDDYFLQEAWATFAEQLSVGFLPPDTIARTMEDVRAETIFLYNWSGSVSEYRDAVEQHPVPIQQPAVKARVLDQCASEALEERDRPAALVLLRRAYRLIEDSSDAVLRYAEALRLNARADQAVEVLKEFSARHPDDFPVRRAIINICLLYKFLDEARLQVDRLLQSERNELRDYAKSVGFRVSLEERARALGLRPHQRIGVWWMQTPYPGNLGDILSPYLIEKITGAPPRFVPRGVGMLAVGSVIKFAKEGTIVWGSGTPRMTDVLSADATYLAVRGPLTRELVLKSGGTCPEVFGDPALLLPRIYPGRKPGPTKFKVGLIRHYRHAAVDVDTDAVKEISIIRCGYDEIERFVDEILECETILSTSLHGLIVAHAYGIPARWCAFNQAAPQIAGDGTKFEDYFRSVGLPTQKPLDLSAAPVLDESLARYVDREVELKFSPDRLLDAFPGKPCPVGSAGPLHPVR